MSVLAEQLVGLRPLEGLAAELQRVPDRSPLGVLPRQLVEERREPLLVVLEVLGQLPQDRAELGAELEDAGVEELLQRLLGVGQPLHVGDEPAALDREDEVVGRLVAPLAVGLRLLQRVEGAVDLDRRQPARGVGQLLALGQPLRVEVAAPGRVGPPGHPDPHRDPPRPWGTHVRSATSGSGVSIWVSARDLGTVEGVLALEIIGAVVLVALLWVGVRLLWAGRQLDELTPAGSTRIPVAPVRQRAAKVDRRLQQTRAALETLVMPEVEQEELHPSGRRLPLPRPDLRRPGHRPARSSPRCSWPASC